MQVGMVGLGRMGANMARRLKRGGHNVCVFDQNPANVATLQSEGFRGALGLAELVKALPSPRVLWVMVPAGAPTENTVNELLQLCEADDIIVDGGNSYYKDDIRRAALLATKGIHYADAGTSGGLWGLERGYCLMVGAAAPVFVRLQPILQTLSPGKGITEPSPGRAPSTVDEGYLHTGPVGSGHFVKMIHNGIEYGMMQAFAEGFDILQNARSQALPAEHRFSLPVGDIAEVWRRGSVVSSWLLDLTAQALSKDPQLAEFQGEVEDSGEGRWTVEAAMAESVPAPVITTSLFARFRSRQKSSFADKVLSAMRFGFGGHVEKKAR